MAADIEELAGYFESKISKVKKCLELRGLEATDETVNTLYSINQDVSDIEEALKDYKTQIANQNEQLKQLQLLQGVLDVYDKEVHHIENNLPEHLPKRQSIEKAKVLKESNKSGTNEQSKGKKVNKIDMTGGSYQKISYLTTVEFDTLPKYLKGRLTYQQVNTAIDEIHKVLAAKYKILGLSRAGMSETNMKKYRAFKEQESSETKGWYFFIDKDLKEYSSFKLDKSGQSILSILRHCGRLKEMRSGKLVRLVVQP